MGNAAAHHVLVDLRRATITPLPEALLARALEHLRRLGLGVNNKVAVVTDLADAVRADRADAAEAVATFLRMQVRSFRDYGAALDWLRRGRAPRMSTPVDRHSTNSLRRVSPPPSAAQLVEIGTHLGQRVAPRFDSVHPRDGVN